MQPRIGERFDRYIVEALIGSGGMGHVYRARDEKLRRLVALKIVRVDAAAGSGPTSDGAARLLREARSAAALDHANAVAIFDVGELDGCAFIAMELVEGQNLRAYVGDATVPIAERVRWLVDAARALSAAHKRDLVHRDVKPENVMIRTDGAVKVLDFGIARRFRGGATAGAATVDAAVVSIVDVDTITREGVVVGTPAYMAPEQLRGDSLDGRADQFAWAVVAYELLTGKSPWPTQASGVHVVAAILTHEVEPLKAVLDGIPAAVSDAVARALSKRPSERFATMDDLIAAMGGEMRSAPPAMKSSPPISPAAHTDVALATTRVSADPSGSAIAKRRKRPVLALVLLGAAAIIATALLLRTRVQVTPVVASALTPSSSAPATPPPAVELVERRLTAFAAENLVRGLAVSADGRAYAYADEEGVWTASVTDASRHRVPMPRELGADARPQEMEFFPDGARILVGGWKKDDTPTWIVPLDGSPPTRARIARGFALSPDGSRLAFIRDEGVVVGSVDGGTPTRVVPVARDEHAYLAWSPDGSALAILRVTGTGMSGRVEVVAADGSWSRTIVSADGLVHTTASPPTWTAPDRVAYAQTLGEDTTAIMEIKLDENHGAAGAPRRLWSEPLTQITDLKYRAGRFFFERMDSQRDVYVGRVASGAARLETPLARFTTSEANDALAGWLPDGRVLFTSMRDGKARIYAQALAKRVPDAIFPGDAEMVAVAALADGDVVAVRHAGEDNIVIRAHPGGASRDLFSLGAIHFRYGRVEVCARCATTSAPRCVISEVVGEETSFAAFDPATGKKSPPFFRAEKVAFLPYCGLSPDGSTLYLPRDDTVRVVTVATGAMRELKGPPSSKIQFAAQTPDGRGVLFSGMSLFGHQYALGRIDADGHAESLWTSDVLWIWSPMIAPNGRDIAATVRVFDSDVWMVAPRDAP